MKLALALMLGGATFLNAAPNEPMADTATYSVAMKIRENGMLLGEPRLIVAGNQPSKIVMGKADGSKFSMSFTVSPLEGTKARMASDIEVTDAQGRVSRASPALIVPLGASGGFAFGAKQGWSPTTIDFTISKPNTAAKG